MADSISNSDDMIDSRDVIKRIEELTEERDSLQSDVDDAQQAANAAEEPEAKEACTETLNTAKKALAEWIEDNGDELKALEALQSNAEGYSDWLHGAQLIRESYFEEYAQQLAEDIGAIAKDAAWPACHIDWEAAAAALKVDYTTVEFDGVSYYVR